tara:strand:+ start:632 stop:739 length:108 start_codon:yes stop_codon:yes gene_type:complete
MKVFIIDFLMWAILFGVFISPYIIYIQIISLGSWT